MGGESMTEDLFQSGLFAPRGVTFVQVPERARRVWLWSVVSWTTTFSVLVSTLVVLIWLVTAGWSWRAGVCGSIPMVVGVLVVSFRVARLRRHWLMYGYCLDVDQLWVRGGLFTREVVSVPYGRIQTVSVSSGPLQRRLRLAALHATTATGGTYSVQCLDQEDAAILREHLAGLTLDRGVEL
jgi:uncharacterized protein